MALPLAYVIAGRLGLMLAVSPGYATAVFLPAGIAVAAAFMMGASSLPGILLGSFVLNVWIGYSLGRDVDAISSPPQPGFGHATPTVFGLMYLHFG